MVSSISLNAYSYSGIVSGSTGKLYVPVSPSAVIYSHFDHISGVAAPSGEEGISVSKIRILNSLLNQLIAMKKMPAKEDFSGIEEKQNIDNLIKQYQEQIQRAVDAAKVTGYGLAGAAPESGAVFSLEV